MTITFYCNFISHHELPLSLALINEVGEENFHFVACEPIHEERTKMGYEDECKKYSFVIRPYESERAHAEAIKLAETSDIVIIGSATPEYAEIRRKNNKLTFLYRERLFKNGAWHRFYPPTAYKLYKDYTRVRNKNFYILAASAYTANDVQLCGFHKEKCLKWGYFPELMPQVSKPNDKLRIMWCGRMLWWKHPEDAVEVARYIKSKGVLFDMKIIGNGEKRNLIEKLISKYELSGCVQLFDFMPPNEIRKIMNETNVYLFTSGKQEGWGVVLNEAMNSGCAVIANSHAGSAPYLIEDRKSGFLYDGSTLSLQHAIDDLLHSNLSDVANKAYETINNKWSPTIAAKNLLDFAKSLQYMPEGPCSMA